MSEAGVGHNSGIAGDQLRSYVERIERLIEERSGIQGNIREVFSELKGNGFDAKAVRKIIAIRRIAPSERQEQDAILNLYLDALGIA